MTVCGEAENAQSAIRAIESRDPDIALVDISLKGINGIELIKMIRNQSTLPLLVLSAAFRNDLRRTSDPRGGQRVYYEAGTYGTGH